MERQLFAERFAIEAEPSPLPLEAPVYDEGRSYAVLADGTPAVGSAKDEDVKTLTAVAAEGADVTSTSMMRATAGGERTITKVAAEAPRPDQLARALVLLDGQEPLEKDPG